MIQAPKTNEGAQALSLGPPDEPFTPPPRRTVSILSYALVCFVMRINFRI